MIIVEDEPTRSELPFPRRIEMTAMEVFLDFDPVFPGWPPTKVSTAPRQNDEKGSTNDGQHRHQRKRLSAAQGDDSRSATSLALQILRELA
jgi:hypothetical protein